MGSATSVPTAVAMSGDASISNTGAVTVTGGSADEIAITDDTTTNATMYPVWVTANTGDLAAKVSSSKLSFNPSTATLTTTTFSGALSGNATTASNLANGTYNYGSGAIIVNANTAVTAANLANGTYNYGSGAIIVNANNANYATTCGTIPDHHHSATAGDGSNTLNLGTGYLTTGALASSTGLKIIANEIYECQTNSAYSLYLNLSGYNGGNTQWRSSVLCNGKGDYCFASGGGSTSARQYTDIWSRDDSTTPNSVAEHHFRGRYESFSTWDGYTDVDEQIEVKKQTFHINWNTANGSYEIWRQSFNDDTVGEPGAIAGDHMLVQVTYAGGFHNPGSNSGEKCGVINFVFWVGSGSSSGVTASSAFGTVTHDTNPTFTITGHIDAVNHEAYITFDKLDNETVLGWIEWTPQNHSKPTP